MTHTRNREQHNDSRHFALLSGKPQKVGNCSICRAKYKTDRHMHCTLCDKCAAKYGRRR